MFTLKIGFDICLDMVIVEKRIVDIDQKYDLVHRTHFLLNSLRQTQLTALSSTRFSLSYSSDWQFYISARRYRYRPIVDVPRVIPQLDGWF